MFHIDHVFEDMYLKEKPEDKSVLRRLEKNKAIVEQNKKESEHNKKQNQNLER